MIILQPVFFAKLMLVAVLLSFNKYPAILGEHPNQFILLSCFIIFK